MSPSDLSLLKLTGCLQDTWSGVGCFGDDYHTVSHYQTESTGGARRPLMTCSQCTSWVSIDFSLGFADFPSFSLIFMKTNQNNEKSMKTQLTHRLQVITQTSEVRRAPPVPLILYGNRPQITPHHYKRPGGNQ